MAATLNRKWALDTNVLIDLAAEVDAAWTLFETIAAQFSAIARQTGLLPASEIDDGVILAEASLGGTALLVSADKHLHEIDQDALRLLFESQDLKPIPTASPARLCALFGKQTRFRRR